MSGSLKIEIEDMADDAFVDAPREEVARILRELAKKIEDGHGEGGVHDINGNKVGSWVIELPEVDSEHQRER